jgi:hypothetical protein
VGSTVQGAEKAGPSAIVTVTPPTASTATVAGAPTKSNSVSSFLASLTPTPFSSSLSSSVRSPAEEMCLLRERKRKSLQELIARKARTTHGEMIQTIDIELERFARLTAQTHQALGYFHSLSTTLSARVVDLTSQLSTQAALLNSVLERFVSLRNAQELRSLEVREQKATAGTARAGAKAEWIAPHYAVEESKQESGQPLLRSGSTASRGGMTSSVHRGIRLSPPETDSSSSSQHSVSHAWLRSTPSSPRTLLHHRSVFSQPLHAQAHTPRGGAASARASTGELGSPTQRSSTVELSQTAPIVKDSSGSVLPLPAVASGSQQPGDVSARASTASLNTSTSTAAPQRRPLLFTSPAPPTSGSSTSLSPRSAGESVRLSQLDPISRMHLQMASLIEGRRLVQAEAANRPGNTVHLPMGNRRTRARQPSSSGGLQDS